MKISEYTDGLNLSRLVLIGVFLLVTGATTAMFAQAATGHLAAMHAPDAEVTVVNYESTDDGSLDLTLRIHNPTIKDLQLVNARMNVYVDGAQVSDGTTSSFEEGGTIEPGESKQVTVPLGLRDGGRERLQNADSEQITVRGKLRMSVIDEPVTVPIDGMEVAE
jgi:LEA14-like dessication related protein